MHALATLAVERDGRITENLVDKVVHRRLLETTILAALAGEGSRTSDLLVEEIGDI